MSAVDEAREALYRAAERNTGYGSMTMAHALKEPTAALIAAVRAETLDVEVLQRLVEHPLTAAYFEDYKAGRFDSEQVARALAGDYRAALEKKP